VDAADLATASRRFVLHSPRRDRCVTFARGDNARLWDADGREYLDTMSGSAGPAMVGHANPRVAAAVAAQMARLPTTNILHQSDAVIAYCARLAGVTPPGLTRTALLAGGGDAIEAAVKLAMRVTGRTEILSLHGAYHGLLCQFGGIDGNVLKFKPPLTTPDDDFERMLGLVADVTAFIQQTVHGRAAVHA
jgi:4-aminobutyrate aminotransferase-like enzyme